MPIEAARIDPAAFQRLFRHHAGGVVVVTLDAGAGPTGFTVTSLSSVSLHPPLVSFAVDQSSSSWPHLSAAETIVVNFLGNDQQDLARRFATSGIDRFAPPVAWTRRSSGEPVLQHARRWLRARVSNLYPAGDHRLVVAEIIEVTIVGHDALVYHGGTFHPIGAVDG
jgi:flavin reductase (DIM6/NTAB) family NADH-FMN oxidoreductase RutF